MQFITSGSLMGLMDGILERARQRNAPERGMARIQHSSANHTQVEIHVVHRTRLYQFLPAEEIFRSVK